MAELNETAARSRAPRPTAPDGRCWSPAASDRRARFSQPLGALSLEAASGAFAEQAAALARGGADLLWIETMSSVEETEAALAGRARRPDLPVVATLSFDTNGRTMMGITPSDLAGLHRKHRSRGLRQQLRREPLGARRLHRQSRRRLGPLRQSRREGQLRHPEIRRRRHPLRRDPRIDGGVRRLALDAGARIIGGCCGTTPEHLRVMRRALESHVPGPSPTSPPSRRSSV